MNDRVDLEAKHLKSIIKTQDAKINYLGSEITKLSNELDLKSKGGDVNEMKEQFMLF